MSEKRTVRYGPIIAGPAHPYVRLAPRPHQTPRLANRTSANHAYTCDCGLAQRR